MSDAKTYTAIGLFVQGVDLPTIAERLQAPLDHVRLIVADYLAWGD